MEQEDQWSLEFWENRAGNCPVSDVIDGLDVVLRNRAIRSIERLKKYTIRQLIKANNLENLKNGLWEFKIHTSQEFRMLGIIMYNKSPTVFIAVHAFIKKQSKIKSMDMSTALKRSKEIIH